MNDSEIWRDIPGYRDFQISNHGRVRNVFSHNILGCGLHNGRIRVNLYQRGQVNLIHVHRLVAEAFLPDFDKRKTVLHKDRDRTNNHYTNLYMGDRVHTLLPKDVGVQVIETGDIYPSISAAARAVGGQTTNVARVLNSTLRHHKGFTFQLVKI